MRMTLIVDDGADRPPGARPARRPTLRTVTDLDAVQTRMAALYGERDRARGVPATVAWLAEEVGELARAARKGTRAEQLHELGDVLAWLASLANQLDCSLAEAFARYDPGCPRCAAVPCSCPEPSR